MWKTCLYFVSILAIVMVVSVTYAAEFENPIGEDSFLNLLIKIADTITKIAIPIAVIAIIIAGLRFIIAGSRGDEGELKTSRKIFWWILIGTAIVVGGSLLVRAVANTLKNLG